MPISDRRHFTQRARVVAALLVILGIAGFLVTRSGGRGPDDAKQAAAGPVSTPDTPRPFAAPGVPANVASRAAVAMPAASDARRPVPTWQASLQPVVVAATRVESLAAYQVQMERWSCEGEQCVGNFRIPPTAVAGQGMSAAARIFDSLKVQMAQEDVDVSLSSIHPGPQGMAVSFQFTPNAAVQGRYYTPGEIAAIRLESFEQGRTASEQGRDQRGQDPAH